MADIDKTVNVGYLFSEPEQLESGHSIGVDLTSDDTHQKVVYFSAPPAYLGNKLVAYGGALNYTIFYTTGLFGTLLSTMLSYRSLCQPRAVRFQIMDWLVTSQTNDRIDSDRSEHYTFCFGLHAVIQRWCQSLSLLVNVWGPQQQMLKALAVN